MTARSVPPEERQHGWSATAVALAIFLSGMAVLIVLVVWALTQSNGVPSAVAAPVIPAATEGTPLRIEAEGADAQAAVDKLAELFEKKFGEED